MSTPGNEFAKGGRYGTGALRRWRSVAASKWLRSDLGAMFLPRVGACRTIIRYRAFHLEVKIAVLTSRNRAEFICDEKIVVAAWTCTQHEAKEADECQEP